jgi:hypothetical protein
VLEALVPVAPVALVVLAAPVALVVLVVPPAGSTRSAIKTYEYSSLSAW